LVDPYVVNMSGFAQFDFYYLPAVLCLEAGTVRRMLVTRTTAGYSLEWTRVSRRYCAGGNPDTYTEPPRALTPQEVAQVLETFRTVEIKKADPPSCLDWMPLMNCSARWDSRVLGLKCTIDHLSSDMVGRLFTLVDSLDGHSNSRASHVPPR